MIETLASDGDLTEKFITTMNRNAVKIFNGVVDMMLERALLFTYTRDEETEARKYYGAWRKRGDILTNEELEKEYGPLE
jgi:hypothetical protein